MEGQGPPPMFPPRFDGPPPPDGPPDPFFGRPAFDEMERRGREDGRHPRGAWGPGPRRGPGGGGPPGGRDEGRFRGGERDGPGPWRRDEEGMRRGSRSEEKQGEEMKEPPSAPPSGKTERDRARKSRWSNASPTNEPVATLVAALETESESGPAPIGDADPEPQVEQEVEPVNEPMQDEPMEATFEDNNLSECVEEQSLPQPEVELSDSGMQACDDPPPEVEPEPPSTAEPSSEGGEAAPDESV